MHLRRVRSLLARHAAAPSTGLCVTIAQLVVEGDADAGDARWRASLAEELAPILITASEASRHQDIERPTMAPAVARAEHRGCERHAESSTTLGSRKHNNFRLTWDRTLDYPLASAKSQSTRGGRHGELRLTY